eukprot:2237336-Rhodomonas_salina.4
MRQSVAHDSSALACQCCERETIFGVCLRALQPGGLYRVALLRRENTICTHWCAETAYTVPLPNESYKYPYCCAIQYIFPHAHCSADPWSPIPTNRGPKSLQIGSIHAISHSNIWARSS